MLRIGIFGVGHLGKIHARILRELKDTFEVTGFYDPSDEASTYVETHLGIKRFKDIESLIDASDCVDIVTPTVYHFDIASKAIRKSKHVFIEKPVTQTVDEAKMLMQLAAEASVQVQIGHVERFNPAFICSLPYINRPMFIEIHRLAQYNPRGTDVSVVLDLMIHDLDIVLSVVKSNIKRVSANGVAVVSDTPDIANARIEFDNGCVANLTASRISQINMRKTRLFQRNAYISVDFLEKTVEVIHQNKEILSDNVQQFDLGTNGNSKVFSIEKPAVPPSNAIQEELLAFAEAIRTNGTPPVSIEDAYHSMELAAQIMERLKITGGGNGDNN
jgi:predicted dehydrogenase